MNKHETVKDWQNWQRRREM